MGGGNRPQPGGVFGALRALDAFPKVNEDFFQKTMSGGIITMVAYSFMLLLFLSETRERARPARASQVPCRAAARLTPSCMHAHASQPAHGTAALLRPASCRRTPRMRRTERLGPAPVHATRPVPVGAPVARARGGLKPRRDHQDRCEAGAAAAAAAGMARGSSDGRAASACRPCARRVTSPASAPATSGRWTSHSRECRARGSALTRWTCRASCTWTW